MPHRFDFDPDVLLSVAGGRSAIDMPRLSVKTAEVAREFISSYGFNLDEERDVNQLWYFHRRALVLLTEKLGFSETEIPEVLKDRKQLGDISQLLIFASSTKPEERELQRWSCALLRCLHVYVHSETDLFSSFSQEIQQQVLAPFQDCIFHGGSEHGTYMKSNKDPLLPPIDLVAFEVKPFKASTSTVIKLLAKPDALAIRVYDKLGVRFVTKSLFDCFQVVRLLTEENIISYPHIMPDQSSNNLYPVALFMKACETAEKHFADDPQKDLSQVFEEALQEAGVESLFFRKSNEQSGEDFKFIKFIARKLIHIQMSGREPFSFFYPFEIQIMDQNAYQKVLSGPSEHEAYKERQRQAARKRVMPEEPAL